MVEHLVLTADDPDAANTAEAPNRVVPRRTTGAEVADGLLRAQLPALSWNVIRLAPQSDE